MSILDRIHQENDIKNIEQNLYQDLAAEIRRFLIDKVSQTGGHLASNLGTVELTMALHLCMDLPSDKIIWDVGHQSYTHKILTGRKSEFDSLRQMDGMSGFPKFCESKTDVFNTGHSSTSISAALGFAKARELTGGSEKICAVIGDGSMTGGMVYEALNQMTQLKSGCVIILNDNEMSIGKNVGGISKALNKIRVGAAYNGFKTNIENALLNIPDVGYKMAKGIKRSKDSIKNLLVPGMFFEEMGITYVGPIDGHNIEEMVDTFTRAFRLNKPIIVHVKTVKGKGYRYAERYPEHFHGVEPFDVNTGKSLNGKRGPSYTDVFAKKLLELGAEHDNLVAITAAMANGTGISTFQKKFPRRTFDVGIAEQHAVTFAAGLAAAGFVPVVAIYSSFLQRAYDQILHDVCLQNLHVIFAVDRSGLVGADGETHQGIYDTGYLSQMPNMTVIAPKNDRELEAAMEYAMEKEGPVAVKYSRGEAYTGLSERQAVFEQGRSELVSDGAGIAIIACGNMMETAVSVRDKLAAEAGITPVLINARFIKPMDCDMLRYYGARCEAVAVLEECTAAGSYGERAAAVLQESGSKARFLHFCIKQESVKHGDVASLRHALGLDADTICAKITEAIRLK